MLSKKILLGVVFAFGVISCSSSVYSQEEKELGESDYYCDASLRLVMAKQHLADEHFLEGGDTALVRLNYKEAIKLSDNFMRFSDCDRKELFNLVYSYSNYRLLLLDQGFDFWGVKYNMSPLNPIREYAIFENLKESFDEVHAEITAAMENVEETEEKVRFSETQAEVQIIRSRIETFQEEKASVNIENYEQQIGAIQSRLSQIDRRHREIETKGKQLSKQIDAAQSSLQKEVLSGLTQAAGIPVDITKLDMDASFDQQLLQIGGELLGNEQVMESMAEVSGYMDEMVKTYQKLDEIKEKVEDFQAIANQVEKLVNEPTFDKLVDLGERVYNELPESYQEELKENIASLPLTGSLLQMAEELKEVENVIKTYLADHTLIYDKVLDAIAEETGFTMPEWANDITYRLIAGESPEAIKKSITALFVKQQTQYLYGQFPPEIRGELKRISGKSTDAEVIEWFKTVNVENLTEVEYKDGKILFPVINQSIDIQPLIAEIKSHPIVTTALEAKRYFEELKKMADNLGYDLGELILADLNIKQVQVIVDTYFGVSAGNAQELNRKNVALTRECLQQLSSQSSDTIRGEMAKMTLGNNLINQHYSKTINAAPQPPSSSGSNAITPEKASDQDVMMNALFNAGLAYACPYAAIAISLANKYSAMKEMVNEAKALDKESRKLTVEKLHLYDLLESTTINKKLAQLDKQIYESRNMIANTMVDFHLETVEKNANAIGKYRSYIQLRLSLLFYLAERLRQQYYILDKAIDFRHNTTIENKVKDNPENVRLALDHDIRLFEWLERDVERQRYNLDELKVHWDRMHVLIEDNCPECKSDFAPLVNVVETKAISIRDAFPEEWSAFQEAVKRGDESFTFSLPILPGAIQEKLVSNANDIRVLKVRIGAVGASNEARKLYNFTLAHPGVAYIPTSSGFKKDILIPSPALNAISYGPGEAVGVNVEFDDWPKHFDPEQEQLWWAQKGGKGDGPFEGYGLFTIWKLELTLTEDNRTLKDLRLRWACSSTPENNPPQFNYYVAIRSGDDRATMNFSGNQFIGLGSIEEVSDRLTAILNKYEPTTTVELVTDEVPENN